MAGRSRFSRGPPPSLPEFNDAPPPICVLLDTHGYIDARSRRNATTATAVTTSGQDIEVTFYTAHPPFPSHFSVHCPGLGPDHFGTGPKVIAAEDDLVLFRVSICLDPSSSYMEELECADYFVYRAHSKQPSLDLLPRPPDPLFHDRVVALLPRPKGNYVVAALRRWVTPSALHDDNEMEFCLYLYRRKGKAGWTSKLLLVTDSIRDIVCPVPSDLQEPTLYHQTWKTITYDRCMVGWVDLWRGILLCNVLDNKPELRDMPLPLPARGNWSKYLMGFPYRTRDVTVTVNSEGEACLKYIEMEIRPTRKKTVTQHPASSYHEWLCCPRPRASWVHSGWKATTWSMPIPVCSWNDWRLDYSVDVAELAIGYAPEHSKLLPRPTSKDEVEATEATLGHLFMAHPILSLDHDILYLLSGLTSTHLESVVAVDMKKKIFQGVAKLDPNRNSVFLLENALLCSDISKYLYGTTGASEAHTQGVTSSQETASKRTLKKTRPAKRNVEKTSVEKRMYLCRDWNW